MSLNKEKAQVRSLCIVKGSIHYDFHLNLQAGTQYSGITQITFSLSSLPPYLFVDFTGKQVRQVLVNSQKIEQKRDQNSILIDSNNLVLGQNIICVEFCTQYDNDGSGCVSFRDVDDGQYVCTQFAPYYANRVLPCFDQPDLKATMLLNVLTPASWKRVISNEHPKLHCTAFTLEAYLQNTRTQHQELLISMVSKHEGNMSMFHKTPPLPTYLYCFVSGAYKEFPLQSQKIPMSVYCIQSEVGYLERMLPFIKEITTECMDFYEQFFGHKFAFSKYDQVFAHEYKWGAMENAGIVIINNRSIIKQQVSNETRFRIADLIAHELSHHWFGNLVTMRWWDDLWLNESFADFISHFCLGQIKHKLTTCSFQSSMGSFFYRKCWGYEDDDKVTTHPIRSEVRSTAVAESLFDGITYAKGAATLKQLLFLVEEEHFSNALKNYFHQYAFDNATLVDFIAELQKQFLIQEFSLDKWKEVWLERPSFNVIEPCWNPEAESLNAQMVIKMKPRTMQYSTLRPHKIKIALYKEDLSFDVIQTLLHPQQENYITYDGTKKYKAILLNYEDYTFVRINLDKNSQKFFINQLTNLDNMLTRAMIWESFYHMMKDAVITSRHFINIVLKNIVNEKSDAILQKVINHIHDAIQIYTPIPHREKFAHQVFRFIVLWISKIQVEKKNRIFTLTFKLQLFAKKKEDIYFLLSWKMGENKQFPFLIAVEQEWKIVTRVFTLLQMPQEEKNKIFEEQNKKDQSQRAKIYSYTCDAIKANQQQFYHFYELFKNSDLSLAVKKFIKQGLFDDIHREKLLELKRRYFQDIEMVAQNLSGDHLSFFVNDLQPIDDDLQETIKGYESIHLQGEKYSKVRNDIAKVIDNLKHRIKAYDLFNKQAQ